MVSLSQNKPRILFLKQMVVKELQFGQQHVYIITRCMVKLKTGLMYICV